jgi:uncharacterized protein YaaR (DUF327 family)
MDKTVYFLGAGATKDVVPDAPLNDDLVKKTLESFKESSKAKRLFKFINDIFHKRQDPPINNQIWNLLDYIIQQGKTMSPNYKFEKIVDLRKGLLELVIKEFQKTLETRDPVTYSKFINNIKSTKYAIVSTNYDIFIDNALSKQIGLNYGPKVRVAVKEESEDRYGLVRPISFPAKPLNKGKKPLLKIHGSLSWLYCPKCDEVDVTIGEKGAVKTLSGEYYCYNPNCTCKYEPLLITPTMFKNYENRFVKETWCCAERELADAQNLVFIGYSLKDEDYQIRCLLLSSLLNKRSNYNKVIVVEKKPENDIDKDRIDQIEVHYRLLYGDIVDFRPIGFTGYVNSM